MPDTRIYKTSEEQNETTNDLDMGIGIDNIPKEIKDKKFGSSEKNSFKVNTKPLDDNIRKVLKPKPKDDPFNRQNWGF